MEDSVPSLREWRALYRAAVEFKEIECWRWMYDSDLFGVQDPVSGEIGYCCIMGNLGELFALAVYLGSEGLEGYLKIQAGEILPGDTMEALTVQKCLMASFEDRGDLKKRDLQVIKELGLKFRGRNAWPLFRSYRPGYHPWYLTAREAVYLTLALEQAKEVALRFREDPELLTPAKENHCLVRVPERAGRGWRWRDEWLEPAPPEREEPVVEPPDEALLDEIRKRALVHRGTWEMDLFYFPGAVKEGERPYYPQMLLWVNHHSGFILGFDMAKPGEYGLGFAQRFAELVEDLRFLPQEVWVRREETFALLEPLAEGLGIELKWVERLPALEEAQDSLFEFDRFGPAL